MLELNFKKDNDQKIRVTNKKSRESISLQIPKFKRLHRQLQALPGDPKTTLLFLDERGGNLALNRETRVAQKESGVQQNESSELRTVADQPGKVQRLRFEQTTEAFAGRLRLQLQPPPSQQLRLQSLQQGAAGLQGRRNRGVLVFPQVSVQSQPDDRSGQQLGKRDKQLAAEGVDCPSAEGERGSALRTALPKRLHLSLQRFLLRHSL